MLCSCGVMYFYLVLQYSIFKSLTEVNIINTSTNYSACIYAGSVKIDKAIINSRIAIVIIDFFIILEF